MIIANGTNLTTLIVPVSVALTVIAVCLTVFLVLTWNVEPWTRKYLNPFKQFRTDWWRVRIYKLRSKHPETFTAASPFREQQLDVRKSVEEILDHVATEKSNA